MQHTIGSGIADRAEVALRPLQSLIKQLLLVLERGQDQVRLEEEANRGGATSELLAQHE